MAAQASREKVVYHAQLDMSPSLIPDYVIAELKAILETRDVDVQFAFEPLCRDGDLQTACIDAVKARLNNQTIGVGVEIGGQNAGIRFMTFHLTRPQ